MKRNYPSMISWILLMAYGLFHGFRYWNDPYQKSNLTAIFGFAVAGCCLIIVIFLCLFRFKKGRAFLRKLPVKWVQERAAEP